VLGPPAWIGEGNQPSVDYGYSVAGAGDVNGDGFADVIVGAREHTNGQLQEGRAYVYLGSATGLSTTPDWTVESDQDFAILGQAVSSAGDVDGDGYDDVLVSAPWYDTLLGDDGRVWLYRGSSTGLSATPAWSYDGDQFSMKFGYSLAPAGDVNGDGYDDIVVGAIGSDGSGTNDQGRAYLFLGSPSGLSTTPAWTADGSQTLELFGFSVAGAGDVNADGFDDVLIGANRYSNGQGGEGRAVLYLGSPGGLSATPAWSREGNQSGAAYGIAVAGAGDVNGDGYSDALVGAYRYDAGQVDEGRAYLYLGSATGLSTVAAWIAEGDQTDAHFGTSVGSAGDLSADGFSDVIVGAFFFESGESEEGGAFLFMGSPSGPSPTAAWVAEGNQVRAHLGHALGGAGDVDGDGYDDVLISALDYDVDQPNEGAVFLYAGRSTALAVVRNGDGTNPSGYSAVTQPVLGSPWLLDVDVTTPGHLGSLVSVGLGGAISGPHTSGLLQGQLLVRGPFLVDFAAGSHAIALPAEVALFGTTLATQAATFTAGVVRLNNAIDATLGY